MRTHFPGWQNCSLSAHLNKYSPEVLKQAMTNTTKPRYVTSTIWHPHRDKRNRASSRCILIRQARAVTHTSMHDVCPSTLTLSTQGQSVRACGGVSAGQVLPRACVCRKSDSIHHHYPEGVVYRSFCLNSSILAQLQSQK